MGKLPFVGRILDFAAGIRINPLQSYHIVGPEKDFFHFTICSCTVPVKQERLH